MPEKTKSKKAADKTKEEKPASPSPQPRKFGPKALDALKKILSTKLGKIAILVLVAIPLSWIPISREFSSDITSKQVKITLSKKAQQRTITFTIHPYLRNLTISANSLNMETNEFIIEEANEPRFKGISDARILKAKTKKHAYYGIENTKRTTIPTIISFQAQKQKPTIKFQTEEKKDANENIIRIQLSPGKTILKLTTEEILLLIHESEIKYGTETTETDGRRIEIKGKPSKINLEMLGTSNPMEIKLCTEKKKISEVKFEEDISELITGIEFLQANPESTIHPDRKKPIQAKDDYPANPTMEIKGKIEKIPKFSLTDGGISVAMEGRYSRIKIAQATHTNTALDETIEFLGKIWRFIKDSGK